MKGIARFESQSTNPDHQFTSTIPKTSMLPLKIYLLPQKERIVFQLAILKVRIYII